MSNNHLENCKFLGGFFMKFGYLMHQIKSFTYWTTLVWFIRFMVDVLYSTNERGFEGLCKEHGMP
jgi:hypothetical protein